MVSWFPHFRGVLIEGFHCICMLLMQVLSDEVYHGSVEDELASECVRNRPSILKLQRYAYIHGHVQWYYMDMYIAREYLREVFVRFWVVWMLVVETETMATWLYYRSSVYTNVWKLYPRKAPMRPKIMGTYPGHYGIYHAYMQYYTFYGCKNYCCTVHDRHCHYVWYTCTMCACLCMYHNIAGNIQRRKLSRISRKWVFHGENFCRMLNHI